MAKQMEVNFRKLVNMYGNGEYKVDQVLKGTIFCLTGKMSQPRTTVDNFLTMHGGQATSAPIGSNHVLVVADKEYDGWKSGYGGSSKIQTAERASANIISETDFAARLYQYAHGATVKPKIAVPTPEHYGDF